MVSVVVEFTAPYERINWGIAIVGEQFWLSLRAQGSGFNPGSGIHSTLPAAFPRNTNSLQHTIPTSNPIQFTNVAEQVQTSPK